MLKNLFKRIIGRARYKERKTKETKKIKEEPKKISQLDLENFDTENRIATLKLTLLTNETTAITTTEDNQVTGEIINKGETGKNTVIGFSLMIGIIVIGLLLFLYFSKSLHFQGLFKKR